MSAGSRLSTPARNASPAGARPAGRQTIYGQSECHTCAPPHRPRSMPLQVAFKAQFPPRACCPTASGVRQLHHFQDSPASLPAVAPSKACVRAWQRGVVRTRQLEDPGRGGQHASGGGRHGRLVGQQVDLALPHAAEKTQNCGWSWTHLRHGI
jgi:hypothetical protein